MGIERFFSSIQKNEVTNLHSSFTKILDKKLIAEYLYIDFNSIIYITRNKIIMELNYLLYKIVNNTYNQDKRSLKIIKEYWLNIDNNINPSKFNKMIVSGNNLDNIIIKKVLEYVISMLTNYIEPDKLKLLYIGIDGVPNKSKMIEQKNRRYMGGFISEINEKIFKKHEKEMKNSSSSRYTYEKYKINWNRGKITPGTEFMHNMNNALISSRFEIKLKKTCVNLDKYIYSGPYEPGEGEKKIVDHMRGLNLNNNSNNNNFLIYSPDTDVTLLGLILNTNMFPKDTSRINNLKIIRHNQQKDIYDIINIDKLADNLFSYVINNANIKNNKLNKSSVINDIVFILTIFGNDFVPKLQTFSAKHDFTKIIDKYIKVLITNKFTYLINYSNKSKRNVINQNIFLKVLFELHLNEGSNLQKMYMTSNYKNYDRLVKTLDTNQDDFIPVINTFLLKLRQFNKDVRENTNFDDLITKWRHSKETKFMNKLEQLTRFNNKNNNMFIKKYVDHFKLYKKTPKVNISFHRYNNRTLDDEFQQNKLVRSLEYMGKNTPVTKYDTELYKFNNMFDEYTNKLNATNLRLGYVDINYKTYEWRSDKIVNSVNDYYKDFFNINSLNISDPKMNNLVKTYIDGLIWVFEYYFNDFNEKINRLSASTWVYSYGHAPLMTQIYTYMDSVNKSGNDYLLKRTSKLNLFKVDRSNYFNCLEQFMYVSPVDIIKDIIPLEYIDFVNKNPNNFYPDIKKIANEFWNSKTNKVIDCRGVTFMNKCHLNIISNILDYSTDLKFIKSLRKIKLGFNSMERMGEFRKDKPNVNIFTYGNIISMDKLKNKKMTKMKNISRIPTKNAQYYKNNYIKNKKKYLETGDLKYKSLYKNFKYGLFNNDF